MYNLLTEPLIRVRRKDGAKTALSLPAVLAGLSTDEVGAFLGLMRHQRHAWHTFLVQLAAIAMDRAGKSALPKKETEWRDLLRTLTAGHKADEPWCLVVENVSKPAFMQPPIPEGSLEDAKFKEPSRFPDELDILVTSKSHDVKMHRLCKPEADHWIFSLVTLQTCQGYLGSNNYGISRMNGGDASRPVIGLSCGHPWCGRFQRDVRVLLISRHVLLGGPWDYRKMRGIALMWLESWDGRKMLKMRDLDPFYVEICRRIRLVDVNGRLWVRKAGTKPGRIEAKDLKGNTGDPWTPVHKVEAKALNINRSSGFTYSKIHEFFLSGEYAPGAALLIHPDDPVEGLTFLACVLARESGKTSGLHERAIPVPKTIRSMMVNREERDRLAMISKRRIEDASLLEYKVLFRSLKALGLESGWAKGWVSLLDRRIDGVFFGELWNSVEREGDHARETWLRKIADMGRETLRSAEHAAPIPVARRLRAIAEAELMYEGALRRRFPELHVKEGP